MIDLLYKPITDLVTKTISSFLPAEKMSEKEKIELKEKLQSNILKADWKRLEKEFEDRASARALATSELKNGTAFTGFLAALHRPLWSIVCLAIYTWAMISPSFGMPEIVFTGLHKDVMMTVIFFYFGGRSIEKIFQTLKK